MTLIEHIPIGSDRHAVQDYSFKSQFIDIQAQRGAAGTMLSDRRMERSVGIEDDAV